VEHEGRLGLASTERCGAHVEEDRAVRWQSDLTAEGLAVAGRGAAEPFIEALSPGHDNAAGGHVMQVHRLSLLRVVPHEHAIGKLTNERLAREVVPAPDAEGRRNAQRTRRPEIVDLRRAQ